MTIRFACVLAVSACAAAPHPTPPPATRYELAQFETASCEMACSIHIPMTQTRTWGTLELRGDSATLALGSDSVTPVVICPSIGPRDPFTPCVDANDPRTRTRPSHVDIELRGHVIRHGSRLDIAVAHGDRRIVLACNDAGTTLDCETTTAGLPQLPPRVKLAQEAPVAQQSLASVR